MKQRRQICLLGATEHREYEYALGATENVPQSPKKGTSVEHTVTRNKSIRIKVMSSGRQFSFIEF